MLDRDSLLWYLLGVSKGSDRLNLEEMEMRQEEFMKKTVDIFVNDPDIKNKGIDPQLLSQKLTDAQQKAQRLTAIPNTPVYMTIVVALALVAVAALIGAIALVGVGKTAPEVVIALGSAAIGALAGALVPQKQ